MAVYLTESDLAKLLRENPALRLNKKFSMTPVSEKKSGSFRVELLPTEEEEQELLAEKLDEIGVDWFHPPNGGFRNITTARRLRKMGVKPGVPDIIIITPPPAFPDLSGTVIELKRQDGGDGASDYQKDWLERFDRYKWYTAVCPGYHAAVEVLKQCGYVKE
jgi:hypothetical protein